MSAKSDKEAIEANKPTTEAPDGKTDALDPKNSPPSKNSPKPKKSPGVAVFDRSSQRTGELFKNSDVVFFREGPAAEIKALPKHEADERLVEIKEQSSSFRGNRTVTALELADGSTVTIDGIKVIVSPKKGPANTDGPSLNVHHADVQG